MSRTIRAFIEVHPDKYMSLETILPSPELREMARKHLHHAELRNFNWACKQWDATHGTPWSTKGGRDAQD